MKYHLNTIKISYANPPSPLLKRIDSKSGEKRGTNSASTITTIGKINIYFCLTSY